MVNITDVEKIIANGSKCLVRVGNSAQNAQVIGFVQEYIVRQMTRTLEATVIGSMGSVTNDKYEIICIITINGFIPKKNLISSVNNFTLSEVFSNLSNMNFNGVNAGICEYFDLYDEERNKIKASYFNVRVFIDGKSLIGNSSEK